MTAPDPKILAEAIALAEEGLKIFRPHIADPDIKREVELNEAILAAAKAYQPMREALEEIARQTLPEDMSVDEQLDADFEGACGLMIERARAALEWAAKL